MLTHVHTVLPILILLLLLAFIRPQRYRRLGIAALIGLLLWSWTPVAWLAYGSLEWQYPVRPFPSGDPDAIVVLAASTLRANRSQPQALPDLGTSLRCYHAAWLFKHWRAVPVVASGGYIGETESAAQVMRRMLEAHGVPAEMIWTEERSSSTYENALFTAQLLRSHRINKAALVTEAYHMPRADACFRKAGLIVTPAPCSYRTLQLRMRWFTLLPNPSMILLNDNVLHEWIGLGWYKLTGKI